MRFFVLAGIFLAYIAGYISPTFAAISSNGMVDVAHLAQHHPYLARKARRKVDVRQSHEAYYRRRMAAIMPGVQSATSSDPLMASGYASSPNTTTFSTGPAADDACMNALVIMDGQASNPSGMAVCYNMVSYDNSTGAFQADLKLYKISDGSGDWAMVQQQGMNVEVTYPNATAAYAKGNAMLKRGSSSLSWPRIPDSKRRRELMGRATSPQMMSDLKFVGKVNNSTMNQPYDESTMKQAIMPRVVLSGTSQNGTQLNTTLSTKDASFLHGPFSNDQTVTAPSATPFVLPGTTLGIFPIGLIITGSWALLFILSVGLGTLGRNEHRKSYRRRVKNQVGSSVWR